MEQSIKNKIYEIVSKTLGYDIDKFSDDMNLIEEVGAGDLDYLEMSYRLEKEFNISVRWDEIFPFNTNIQNSCATIKGLENFVKNKLTKKEKSVII